MAIEPAFDHLLRQLRALRQVVSELHISTTEDFPADSFTGPANGGAPQELPPPPVVALGDRISDLEGAVAEAISSADIARKAVHHPRDLLRAQMNLITVQNCLNQALRLYLSNVVERETMQTLGAIGRKLDGPWPAWVTVVEQSVDSRREPLLNAFHSLADCWQELADRLAANSVSLQTTNIGQQISAREPLASNVQEFT